MIEPITSESMGSAYVAMQMQCGHRLAGAIERTTARRIVSQVSEAHHMTCKDLIGPCRTGLVSRARHEAMYRMRQELELSFSQIGRIFQRDHTSVIYGIHRHTERVSA